MTPRRTVPRPGSRTLRRDRLAKRLGGAALAAALAFSPVAERLAAGTAGGTICVWALR